MVNKFIAFIILLIVTVPSTIYAHPGRTDSNGGHTCRTNCSSWGLSTGEYHYHNGREPAPVQQSQPAYIAPIEEPTYTPFPTNTPTRVPTATPTITPTATPPQRQTDTPTPNQALQDFNYEAVSEDVEVQSTSTKNSGLSELFTLGALGGFGFWVYKKINKG